MVKTNAELAPIARTSNAVKSTQPGLRPPRRTRAPRDRTVMAKLYLREVNQRVGRLRRFFAGCPRRGRVG
ncbi:hypothetical protein MAHJHV64_41750 [Mycobacterium avium subsp. hominissuis]